MTSHGRTAPPLVELTLVLSPCILMGGGAERLTAIVGVQRCFKFRE